MERTNKLFQLKKLQANILKSHGREYTLYLLFKVSKNSNAFGGFLGMLLNSSDKYIHSYRDQLCAAGDKYRKEDQSRTWYEADECGKETDWTNRPVLMIAFGRSFYDKFPGIAKVYRPYDHYFNFGISGMGDPSPLYNTNTYEEKHKLGDSGFDLLLTLSHDSVDVLRAHREKIYKHALEIVDNADSDIVAEYGVGRKHQLEAGGPRPFGYKDGISERRSREEIGRLTLLEEEQIIYDTKDRRIINPFGTYLYYQKIKLNNSAFDTNIDKLVEELKKDRLEEWRRERQTSNETSFNDNLLWGAMFMKAQHPEKKPTGPRVASEDTHLWTEAEWRKLAKALLMGRFPNGTPLMLDKREGYYYDQLPFSYDQDWEGNICPFQAHIRKANPRSGRYANADIVRRGTYYLERGEVKNSDWPPTIEGSAPKVAGLHFVSFQRSIANQLIPILRRMAYQHEIDPITYAGRGNIQFILPPLYQNNYLPGGRVSVDLEVMCKYLGGDFYYVPSIYTLEKYRDKMNRGDDTA